MSGSGRASPTLTTSRLRLRDAEPGDAAALLDVTFYDGRPARDAAHAAAIAARIRADQEAGDTLHWVICLAEGGTPIGTIGFYRGIGNGVAELGYVLRAPYRGRGLASEAAAAVCRHGFDAMGLTRIRAWTETDNAASRALLARLGFVTTGTDGDRLDYQLERAPQDSSASGTSSSPS